MTYATFTPSDTYDFNFYEDVQDKIEAFDNLCAAYGYSFDSKPWIRLYIMLTKKDNRLAEGILSWQQSRFAKVRKERYEV